MLPTLTVAAQPFILLLLQRPAEPLGPQPSPVPVAPPAIGFCIPSGSAAGRTAELAAGIGPSGWDEYAGSIRAVMSGTLDQALEIQILLEPGSHHSQCAGIHTELRGESCQ